MKNENRKYRNKYHIIIDRIISLDSDWFQQPTVIKPADPKPVGNDESVPPTYEEAQRLRQESQSTSETEQEEQPGVQPNNNGTGN